MSFSDVSEALERLEKLASGGDAKAAAALAYELGDCLSRRSGEGEPGHGFPRELLAVPGEKNNVVNLLAGHIAATAMYPNYPLAFASALVGIAYMTQRHFCGWQGQTLNCYVLLTASSGAGKSHGRLMLRQLSSEIGRRIEQKHGQGSDFSRAAENLVNGISEGIASTEALQDDLLKYGNSLYLLDEVHDFVSEVSRNRDPRMGGIATGLKSMFSASNGVLTRRSKADNKNNREDGTPKLVERPHAFVLGTGTKKDLLGAVKGKMATDGFLQRFLFVEGDPRGKKQPSPRPQRPFPAKVMDVVEYWTTLAANDVVTVGIEESAKEFLDREEARMDKRAETAEKLGNALEGALFARAGEYFEKLAIISAAGRGDNGKVEVTQPDVAWAVNFVTYCYQTFLRAYAEAPMDIPGERDLIAVCERIIRILSSRGEMDHSPLMRSLGIGKDLFQRAINTLEENGTILSVGAPRNGLKYSLVKEKPSE